MLSGCSLLLDVQMYRQVVIMGLMLSTVGKRPFTAITNKIHTYEALNGRQNCMSIVRRGHFTLKCNPSVFVIVVALVIAHRHFLLNIVTQP